MSYTDLNYHIVFSTRERRAMLTDSTRDSFWKYLRGIAENLDGSILAAGGIADHVHLVVRVPATRDIASFVRDLKSNSSRWLRDREGMEAFHWQDGYAAFTVSRSVVPKVTQYVDCQESHHQSQPFMAELEALLHRHEVAFDREHLES
jgi:putative transposase